jgi:DNA modification methylase
MIKPYYQDDYCTIYNCDCREILQELPKVDIVLTDPPYGIGEAAGKNKKRTGGLATATDYGSSNWDDKTIDQSLMDVIISHGKNAIVWGGNYYKMLPSACWLVWDKVNYGNDFADCELAWTNLKSAVRMKHHQWNGMLRKGNEPRWHPTQKPLDIIKWAMILAGDWNSCLDPFMGSGTTLRAAKDLQRKAIGIEIEEKYCEIAAKRLSQEVLPL